MLTVSVRKYHRKLLILDFLNTFIILGRVVCQRKAAYSQNTESTVLELSVVVVAFRAELAPISLS